MQELVEVIGERYIEVWGMTEGVPPFSATTRDDWRTGGRGGRGARLTQDSVIAYVRTRIASYKRPQRVHFVAALPRNASLKVRKDQLRARLGRRKPDGTGA